MIEDQLRNIRGLYYRSPQWFKNLTGGAYARLPIDWRLGKSYKVFRELLTESQHWKPQEIMDYQYAELRHTLELAYEKIPYYRRRFTDYGVSPSDFKAPEDLVRFPTLTKSEVKENYHDLINPDIHKMKHLVTTTGGSTAEPMRFLQVKGLTRSKERAFIHAGWSRAGYEPGMKAVQIKGRSVGNPSQKCFWEYEPIQNILEMDSNYLTPENIPLYLDAIRKSSASFIIAFPSSIYLLAKFIKQNNIDFPPLQAIFLASENVYPWQREYLKETFGCRVFSHYGHSEMVLLGMEARRSHDLRFFPEYGYLEILGIDDTPLAAVAAQGELVGTSFHNDLMPFIRYRTQDVGVVGGPDPDGGHYPVLSDVEGRLQEFIVTRDNRLISICTMGAAHFDVLDKVHETQYRQEVAGKIEFLVVPKVNYTAEDRERIRRAVSDKTGPNLEVEVREVESIQRTKSGKHMMLVQKLPLTVLDGSQDLVL